MLDYLTALATAVRSRRKELGLTQDQAAERTGAISRTILDIENRKDDARGSTLCGIIRGLQMDANDIFYPEIKCGTPNQVRLQIVFADCSEAEAEMLYEVCIVDAPENHQSSAVQLRHSFVVVSRHTNGYASLLRLTVPHLSSPPF